MSGERLKNSVSKRGKTFPRKKKEKSLIVHAGAHDVDAEVTGADAGGGSIRC